MSLDIEVRDVSLDDVDRLVELLVGGTLRGGENPAERDRYLDAVREISADSHSTILVAVVDQEVVGMCQLISFRHLQERGGLCAEIESMHVDARCRSLGIGGVLVEAAVTRAAAWGCYRVQLTSNTARSDAHRFYLAHGFEASHKGFKRYLI